MIQPRKKKELRCSRGYEFTLILSSMKLAGESQRNQHVSWHSWYSFSYPYPTPRPVVKLLQRKEVERENKFDESEKGRDVGSGIKADGCIHIYNAKTRGKKKLQERIAKKPHEWVYRKKEV